MTPAQEALIAWMREVEYVISRLNSSPTGSPSLVQQTRVARHLDRMRDTRDELARGLEKLWEGTGGS